MNEIFNKLEVAEDKKPVEGLMPTVILFMFMFLSMSMVTYF
jgi:hypothetical protein